MRFLTINARGMKEATDYSSLLRLDRVRGELPIPGTGGTMDISEARLSTALITTTHMDLAIFKLINLTDSVRGTSWSTKQDALNWKAAKIRPLRRGTGMAAFAFRIHCSCGTWATEWSEFLDGIDNASRFDLTDILSHGERLTMMFDDAGSGFALSEFYFTVLQLLRVAHDWIQESVEELKNLAGEFEWQYGPDGYLHDHDQEAAEVSRRNWESVMSHQQSLANGLLSRIAKKREEMSSLRDGLFNATSVREATKSSQLNHYILVFTVVTIFYLPLSFVAALFALDLFKWDAPGQKGSFAAAIVAVAGGTYVCSGLLIWTVRRPERRRTFTRVWIRLWEGCRRRLGWLRRERPVVEDLQRVDSLDGIPGRRGLENSTGVRFAWDLG
ncbi:uncharacterized protein EI97DRAFT_458668 [Westerdykella ornata]|uniref:Cora-domain-containing protein n=1 Tax=Westerdykella ornata TaxID=318751 RepID=A0A6A6JKF3_WESOR|nr:uncharacterized protein EI97DRAFT_458668 [Westerdykella ornata]KAF2276176.1 hypothetical protein EI97DRAFT_458668 [Westerdykella ornata]